jgi:hypothetical protein
VRQRVDVIVTAGTPAGFAMDLFVVPTIGFIQLCSGDCPAGSLMAPELSAKRLDILSTLAPGITRFAILWDLSNPGMAQRVRETQIAADRSHVLESDREFWLRLAPRWEALLAERPGTQNVEVRLEHPYLRRREHSYFRKHHCRRHAIS